MEKTEMYLGILFVGLVLALSLHTVKACGNVQSNVVRILQK